jgi:glycosyl transferase family 25
MEALKNIYYINLDERTDRNEHFIKQMEKLNIPKSNYTRFSAIKTSRGALGCSLSHLHLLEKAKEQNLEYIIIMEDDIIFTNPIKFKEQLNDFLNSNTNFDVLFLAGNLKESETKNNFKRILKCYTTTGYMVKNHYFDTIIQNVKYGIEKLKLTFDNANYAVDSYYLNLQEKDNWYILYPRTVSQLANYSNIVKNMTDYSQFMLDKS